jgi:hypothetical protein
MQLLSNEQKQNLPGLYQTENIELGDKLVIAKLFHPLSAWAWYVIEYDGQDTCWGLVDGQDVEFGYFSLEELRQGAKGLSVERDTHFRPTRVQDLPIY